MIYNTKSLMIFVIMIRLKIKLLQSRKPGGFNHTTRARSMWMTSVFPSETNEEQMREE